MALKDLTRQAISDTIAEFDSTGRDAFLKKYRFGRSRGYFISEGANEYDSKAIHDAGGTLESEIAG